MLTLRVKLDTIELVKNFSNLMNTYPGECDLVAGRHIVDAKSIMGVFSLDLSKPLALQLHEGSTPELVSALKPYLAG